MIGEAAPIITVEHLTNRYSKAATPAVDDISFDVRPGELFAFLGPNGAGKTTTIAILTTTLAKTSGTVTIAGHDLDSEATAVRRNRAEAKAGPALDDFGLFEARLLATPLLSGLAQSAAFSCSRSRPGSSMLDPTHPRQ